MDKNQAIDFIIRQYTIGHGQDEIAQQLSQQMNAPLNLVSKFVAATLDQAFPNQPAPAPAQDFYTTPTVDAPTGFAAGPGEEDFVDLDAVPDSFAAPDFYSPGGGAGGFPAPDGDLDADYAAGGLPLNEAGDFYSTAYAVPSAPTAQPIPGFNPAALPLPIAEAPEAAQSLAGPGVAEAELRALENDPEVEALVLRELGRTTKQNDVVMVLCERNGLDWKQAQRLVARIQSKNRKKLAGQQNRITIPLCILAILSGVGLVLAGLIEFLRLRALYEQGGPANYDLVNSSLSYVRSILPWALTGFALAIGGTFGLVKAIQAQTD